MSSETRIVSFEYPIKPISLNAMYRNFRGRSIISKDGREFKEFINIATRAQLPCNVMEGYDQSGINVKVQFFDSSFITKKGSISQTAGDVDNLFKALCDAVFGVLGVNDSHIIRLELSKHHAKTPKTSLILEFGVLQ